jgi:hypothetical protein
MLVTETNASNLPRTEPTPRELTWGRFWIALPKSRKVHPGGFTRCGATVVALQRADRSFYGTEVGVSGCP